MDSNYDNAAWFYDRLSRVAFGRSLLRAQSYFLPLIPAGAKMLIAGGGTGMILEEIARIHPAGLQITYAEVSANMIRLARKRRFGHNQVMYLNTAVEHVTDTEGFDVLITPFLLDSIPPEVFAQIFDRLGSLLKPGGLWLNTDFKLTGKWWQPLLLQNMYLFFRLTGCTANKQLPPISQAFYAGGFSLQAEKAFYGSFIIAEAYKK